MDCQSASPLKPAVFGLTQPGLEPMIYCTQSSMPTNHFTTDVVRAYRTIHPTSTCSFRCTVMSSFCKNLNSLCTNHINILLYFVNFLNCHSKHFPLYANQYRSYLKIHLIYNKLRCLNICKDYLYKWTTFVNNLVYVYSYNL